MKFIWYDFLICDACANAWPAMVKEEWAAPVPETRLFQVRRTYRSTARPAGGSQIQRRRMANSVTPAPTAAAVEVRVIRFAEIPAC